MIKVSSMHTIKLSKNKPITAFTEFASCIISKRKYLLENQQSITIALKEIFSIYTWEIVVSSVIHFRNQ